jgi:DNA-binding NtrC family response regulator
MTRYPPHILVIDSDEQYRKLLVEILSAKDYIVFSAQDGAIAEFILNNNIIDVILEDVGKSSQIVSEQLIPKVLAEPNTLPKIIAMSGSPNVLEPLLKQIAGIHVKGQDSIEKLLQQVARILFG